MIPAPGFNQFAHKYIRGFTTNNVAVSEGFCLSEPPGEETESASKAVGAYYVGMTSHELIHPIIL